MDNSKKKGILLIVIGLMIPLFALPFVSGFDVRKGFMDNYYNTGIRIAKDTGNNVPAAKTQAPADSGSLPEQKRIDKIPFRLFFVPTILLIYIGIVMIDKARKTLPGQKS
jgi:hypothetical protein